jgi:hypothetical protein
VDGILDPTRIDPDPNPVNGAVVELAATLGLPHLTFAKVASCSDRDEEDLRREFGSVEACYLAVFEELWAAFEGAVRGAFESGREWRQQIRLAGCAASAWVQEHPAETRFIALEMQSADPRARAVREQRVQSLVDLIDAGRRCGQVPDVIGRDMAVGLLGALHHLLVRQILSEDGFGDLAFGRDLLHLVLSPYLGAEAARAEASNLAPAAGGQRAVP